MGLVCRVGMSGWRLLRRGTPNPEVVLRHGPTGRLLFAGIDAPEPVRFASPGAALDFRSRWLDEPQAWAPEPTTTAARDWAA
jgi:hypothetical protein